MKTQAYEKRTKTKSISTAKISKTFSSRQLSRYENISQPYWSADLLQRSTSCACGGGCPSCGRAPALQPKLQIGALDDKYEKEADRVADQVMRMPQHSLQRQEDDEIDLDEEDEIVRTKLTKGSVSEPSPNMPRKIEALRGKGQALPQSARDYFESRFEQNFGGVRVHTNSQATEAARSINARAFTLGKDIAFGAGEYSQDGASGNRLLAHELAHVVQQGSRKTPALLQRKPGVNATDSWKDLVSNVFIPRSAKRQKAAREAIKRYLATKIGEQQINTLWKILRKGRKNRKVKIIIKFVISMPKGSVKGAGKFDPGYPDAPVYTIHVMSLEPHPANKQSISLPGVWPSNKAPLRVYLSLTDPESSMAETLHHELLHIWYIHARRKTGPRGYARTGHGADIEKGDIEPEFLQELQKFANEMGKLEKVIHSRASKIKQKAKKTPPPKPLPEPASPEPKTPDNKPGFVGGTVFVQGGGYGAQAIPGGGMGIVGANLLLGRISAMKIGVRGIYLTPDHLLVGPTLGYRFLQQEDPTQFSSRSIENPFFFDIDAGVLAALPVGKGEQLKKKAHFLFSAGFGQEYGKKGTRFFWKVGGFVLVSDKKEVLGGPSAGVGGRF